jgi:hypothetical protein
MNDVQVAYNIAFIVSAITLIIFAVLLFGSSNKKKR